MRGGAEAARLVHTQEVGGSIPPRATITVSVPALRPAALPFSAAPSLPLPGAGEAGEALAPLSSLLPPRPSSGACS